MNTEKRIANTKDVGGIPVARLLPQKGRRTIGAWCFLDHAGPAVFTADTKHRGVGAQAPAKMQTFDRRRDERSWQQDSLGFRALIRPG